MAWQSGWTKTVRFDMGTSCGPQFVAIALVALPGPRAAYLDPATGAPLFSTVVSHLWGRLRPPTGSRNLVVLADTLGGGGLAGIAGHSYDERAGPGNASNDPGKVAMVFSDDGPVSADAAGAYAPSVFLHEMLHTIGAVNHGAPNSTRAGHCSDGADVMCFDDAGPAAAARSVCRSFDWTLTERVDCGGDDYFNPDPPSGSYLQRSWNVYRSAFLGSCWGELAAACGSDRGWAPPELAPAAGPVAFAELGPVRVRGERGPARRQRTSAALRRVRERGAVRLASRDGAGARVPRRLRARAHPRDLRAVGLAAAAGRPVADRQLRPRGGRGRAPGGGAAAVRERRQHGPAPARVGDPARARLLLRAPPDGDAQAGHRLGGGPPRRRGRPGRGVGDVAGPPPAGDARARRRLTRLERSSRPRHAPAARVTATGGGSSRALVRRAARTARAGSARRRLWTAAGAQRTLDGSSPRAIASATSRGTWTQAGGVRTLTQSGSVTWCCSPTR